NAQLEEGVGNSVDLGQELGMGNGYFIVLVTALPRVGALVLGLHEAGTGLDQRLGQLVGGAGVTENGVDVGDDGHNVGVEVVDLGVDFSFLGLVDSGTGVVQGSEQQVQFTGIGLTQEGVQFFDQSSNGSLLVHGLVGQGTELGAQSGDHPAGQVTVALVGGLQVLTGG